MYRTLGEWGRRSPLEKNKPHQMAWEKKRKVEFGRVGRKCIGHWVNGIEESP